MFLSSSPLLLNGQLTLLTQPSGEDNEKTIVNWRVMAVPRFGMWTVMADSPGAGINKPWNKIDGIT